MNKIMQILFFSALFSAGFFCFNVNNILAVNIDNVVINELAWMGTSADANDEWIELYNNTNHDIDLAGWVLSADDGTPNIELNKVIPANGYFLLERTDDTTVTSITADLIYTGALNNSGEYLRLKNSQDEVVDEVNCNANWFAGDNNTKAAMERVSSFAGGLESNNWQTNNGTVISGSDADGNPILGTPRAKNNSSNSIKTIPKQTEKNGSTNNIDQQNNAIYRRAMIGSVVINELVSDPEDGPEWIELYNKTNNEINLTGWRIEDGSEAETVLEGKIWGYGYFIIENPKGNLNNNGDIVLLFDNFANIIDQISYGGWNDGNINDNAPKSNDPNGIGRTGNSQDTNNDLSDWQIVSVLTPNIANILIAEQKVNFKESAFLNKIIISEIFPNPKGTDYGEFIELQNISDAEIDLSRFFIGDNSKRRHKIKDGSKIKVGDFFVIPRNESKIALNNTGGDKIVLYDEKENIICEAEYSENAPEDKSYILIDNIWRWTDKLSAGAVNILIIENQPPVAVIDLDKSEILVGEELALDCSDSYDPEGKNLIIEWQVGDLLYHSSVLKIAFDKIGNNEIKLMLSDGEKKTVTTRLVNVATRAGSAMSPNLPNGGFGGSTSNVEVEPPKPLINEFLPNPEGSDDAEFIEFFNPNNVEVNLKNFYLDDDDGGSVPYHIKEDVILKPFSYFIFEQNLTKLALNNTNDSVRLLDENKNILQNINYANVVEGASFSRASDGDWFWTKIITKGQENKIEFADQFDSFVPESVLELSELELSKAREMELGEKIKTSGIITVLPGILGSQIFYISEMLVAVENQNSNADIGLTTNGMLNHPPTSPRGGSPLNPPPTTQREGSLETPKNDNVQQISERGIGLGGIQIYSYKKNFPELKIGDEVGITGILSQSGGEHRLKISQKNDIKITRHRDNIEPVKITADQIGKEIEGSFVLVEGEIVEISGSSIFIDDGSGEVKVYLKESSGVQKAGLKERDVISAAGIVSQTNSSFRLLPRFQDDIKKIKTLGVELPEKVEKANSSDIIIDSRDNYWLKYITAGLGAIVLILAAVNFRMRKNNKDN